MSDPNGQTKKRQLLLIGSAITGICILASAGMFLFDSGPPHHHEKHKTVTITAPGTIDDKDAWRAQQAAKEKSNETLILEVKNQLKTQEEQNKKLALALEALKNNTANANGDMAKSNYSVLDNPLPLGSDQRNLSSPVSNDNLTALNLPLNQATEPPKRELEIIHFNSAAATASHSLTREHGSNTEVMGFPTDEKAKRYGTTKGSEGNSKVIEFLPAGSFVRVAMLNGVDAPTGGQAQSNPLPVAFHVLDVANLANRHWLDIKDCRFVAAAWGDLSSERMMGRTETLACIINGETIEMAVKGQVIGEDGKAGVRGRLVTKQGQLLANALFSGALSGIGKAFQQSASIVSTGGGGIAQTVDPSKVGWAAVGGGVGSAGQTLAQYYLKAADKLFPVIETDGGRTVEILITKGVVYNGSAIAKDAYHGLLKRANGPLQRYQKND